MRTWADLLRLLAVLEHEWDVVSYGGSGNGDEQQIAITFRRKAKEESDD